VTHLQQQRKDSARKDCAIDQRQFLAATSSLLAAAVPGGTILATAADSKVSPLSSPEPRPICGRSPSASSVGFEGILSIENEDPILAGEVGVERAAYVLKNVRKELLGE
jgi:hypothetical protein